MESLLQVHATLYRRTAATQCSGGEKLGLAKAGLTNWVQLPAIVPQSGTVVENEFHVQPTNPILSINQPQEQENGLLDISGDIANGTDPQNGSRSSLIRYWPSPQGFRDAASIPPPIVPMVSTATGTHITEESDLARWRIDGANAHSAFARLQSLESAIVSKGYV